MKEDFRNIIKKFGNYSDRDKREVLPGKNVAASFGPSSYVVLKDSNLDAIDKEKKKEIDLPPELEKIQDSNPKQITIKEEIARTAKDNKRDDKNSKIKNKFKFWQNP